MHARVMRGASAVAGIFALSALALTADAGGKRYQVDGANKHVKLEPEVGFVDDPFAFDGAGGRLVYVHADAAGSAELVAYDLVQKAPLWTVDISSVTSRPRHVEFALDGEHFFVTWRDHPGGPLRAALIDNSGRAVRRFGPATDIVTTVYDERPAVVVYERKTRRRAKRRPTTSHRVSVFDLATGKRRGKSTRLDVDASGKSKKLDFTFKYWADDYTTAVGIKGGIWDRKEDQRSPDVEGWYRLPTRTFSKRKPIRDVIGHTRRMEILEKHSNEPRFLEVARDRSALRVFDTGGPGAAVELAEPFHHYLPDSLQYHLGADGTVYFSLTIDRVHPDAAARKRAVRPWMDLYELTPGQTTARRRARILGEQSRSKSWRATGGFWAVLPRHLGFDRGGEKLLLLELR